MRGAPQCTCRAYAVRMPYIFRAHAVRVQYTCGTFSESRCRDRLSSGYESFEPRAEPGVSVHCSIIRRCEALASPLSGLW